MNYSLKRWDDKAPVPARSLIVKGDIEEIQFRNIIHILSKRRWLILLCTAIGVLAGGLVSVAMHRVYSASATIEVDKEAAGIINLRDQANEGLIASGMDLGTDLLTEESVVGNDTTLLTVINRLNLRSKPPFAYDPTTLDKDSPLVQQANLPLDQAPAVRARALQIFNKHLSVRLVKGTRLIEVRYSDPDPNQAAAVTNAILDAYLANYTQTRYETSSKVSTWLAQQLEGLKDDVEKSQRKVTDFEEESGLIGSTALSAATGGAGGEGNNVELNRLVDLNRQLTTTEIDRVGKEALYRLTLSEDPGVVVGLGSTPLAQAVGANAAVVGPGNKDIVLLQQLRNQQAELKIQYASAQTTYGAKNPVLLQISNQLGAIDGQISQEMSRIRLQAKNDYLLSRKAEDGVRASVHEQEEQITKLNHRTAQLDVLEQQARSNRTLYEDLYGKLQEARMASGVRASNTNIVNPARSPDQPSSPRIPFNVGLGLAFGLFCGCTASLVAEYFDDSVESVDEIEGLTGAHILGTIPTFAINSSAGTQKTLAPLNPNGEDRAAVGGFLNSPSSAAAEAYRGFRTFLLAYRGESRPQTVLFTSPETGDGKTTTCINAAVALAQLGCRIVIVDADLRRSSLREVKSREKGAGLSHVLSGQADVMSVIRPYRGVANLSILTSGDLPTYPTELLGSKRFSDVLKTLRDTFDFVFIDSPPLLLVTDALLLATQVDGVVLVLRAAHTTRPALRSALRLLQRVHAPLLGSVLNCVTSKSAEYKTIDSDKIRSAQYAN